MTLKDLKAQLIDRLAPMGNEVGDTVRILMEDVLGYTPTALVIHGDRELEPQTAMRLLRLAERVIAGEPVQYVVGKARFMGFDFKVTPATLIPRPETEGLVDAIIADAGKRTDLRVLDIGTGSGCIAISLARALKFPRIQAIDISAAALAVAKENAEELRVNIEFVLADALTFIPTGKYDIIVSNPPYIADSEASSMDSRVLDHEPRQALFVPDDDPLRFYRAIARMASDALGTEGKLYFEINPLFAGRLKALLTEEGLTSVDITRDYLGRMRYASAETK